MRPLELHWNPAMKDEELPEEFQLNVMQKETTKVCEGSNLIFAKNSSKYLLDQVFFVCEYGWRIC